VIVTGFFDDELPTTALEELDFFFGTVFVVVVDGVNIFHFLNSESENRWLIVTFITIL
jgi:hypothetical protein